LRNQTELTVVVEWNGQRINLKAVENVALVGKP